MHTEKRGSMENFPARHIAIHEAMQLVYEPYVLRSLTTKCTKGLADKDATKRQLCVLSDQHVRIHTSRLLRKIIG
jgi:hypothetical protein